MKLPYFVNLYKDKKYYTIIQLVEGILAVGALLIAGILALINQPLGQSVLIVPAFFAVAFITNVVVLSLAKTIIETLFPWIDLDVASEDSTSSVKAATDKKKKTSSATD